MLRLFAKNRCTKPLFSGYSNKKLSRRTFYGRRGVGGPEGSNKMVPGLMYENMMFIGNVQTELNILEKTLNHGCRSVIITSTVEQKGAGGGSRTNMGLNSDPSAGNTVGSGSVTMGHASGSLVTGGASAGSFKPHLMLYERIRDLHGDMVDADEAAGLGPEHVGNLFLCHRFRNVSQVQTSNSAGGKIVKPDPTYSADTPTVESPTPRATPEGVVSIASLLREQKQKLANLMQAPVSDIAKDNSSNAASVSCPWAEENTEVRSVLSEYDNIVAALGRSIKLNVITVPCFASSSHAQDTQRWMQKLSELAVSLKAVDVAATHATLLADPDFCVYLTNCRTLHKYINVSRAGDPVSLGLDLSTELVHAVSSADGNTGNTGPDSLTYVFKRVVTFLYRELSVINNSREHASASVGESGQEVGTVIGIGASTFAFYAVNPFTITNAYTRDMVTRNSKPLHNNNSYTQDLFGNADDAHMQFVWTETLRSHERKPGLLTNSDMTGINNRSVYGSTGSSTGSNQNSDVVNTDLLHSLSVAHQQEQHEIDTMIAECMEELQLGWKSCVKLEKIYNDKSQQDAAKLQRVGNGQGQGRQMYNKWLYGHVLAATQHSILYPEEWLYIFNTSVDPTVSHYLKMIKDGQIVSDSHSLRDWMILYTPLIKQFFAVYERFLHARKRSILFDLKTSEVNYATYMQAISLLNESEKKRRSGGVSSQPALDQNVPVSTLLVRLLQEAGQNGTAAFVTVSDTEAATNTLEGQWRQRHVDGTAGDEVQAAHARTLLVKLLTGMQHKLTAIHAGVSVPGASVLTNPSK